MQRMEKHIHAHSIAMLSTLKSAEENGALLDADVLRLAGNEIAQSRKASTIARRDTVEDKASDLDWGRFPADEMSNKEIWTDEVGSLKALIKNKCPGH